MTGEAPHTIVSSAVVENSAVDAIYSYALEQGKLAKREGISSTLPAMRKQLVAAIMSGSNSTVEAAKVHLFHCYEALLTRQEEGHNLMSAKIPYKHERTITIGLWLLADEVGIMEAIAALDTQQLSR